MSSSDFVTQHDTTTQLSDVQWMKVDPIPLASYIEEGNGKHSMMVDFEFVLVQLTKRDPDLIKEVKRIYQMVIPVYNLGFFERVVVIGDRLVYAICEELRWVPPHSLMLARTDYFQNWFMAMVLGKVEREMGKKMRIQYCDNIVVSVGKEAQEMKSSGTEVICLVSDCARAMRGLNPLNIDFVFDYAHSLVIWVPFHSGCSDIP